MEWIWPLYRAHVERELERHGNSAPTEADLQDAFIRILGESTVTVLVQEAWQGSVRFKGLARYETPECLELLSDPSGYLRAHFGGGKFKLNFHHGWHFVGTHNFKPAGPPRWKDLPRIDF